MNQGSYTKIEHLKRRIALFKNWPLLLPPLNRFGGTGRVLRLRNGAVLSVDDIFSSDFAVIMEMFDEDMYGLKNLHLPSGAIIVDIGANIGAFSAAVHVLFPTAHITAYEPHPRNFELLQKNAPFATTLQLAVSDKAGEVQIEAEGIPAQRRLVREGGIPVRAVTLDLVLSEMERVDLLKVDVEGSEQAIFSGASPHTMAKVGCAVVEVTEGQESWFEQFFQKHGFTVTWLSPLIIQAKR